MTDIISTLQSDATAVGTFLQAEEAKIIAFVEKAAAPVQAAFTGLVTQAKSDAQTLAAGGEKAVSGELSALAADFETALANAVQKMGNGQPAVVLGSSAGATGLQEFATQAAALVGPLLLKVLAAAI